MVKNRRQSNNTAYLQTPTIQGENIAFITDDDLFSVSTFGGMARRLTNSHGISKMPFICPQGDKVAYLTNDQGQFDIYTIPLKGGIPTRHTYKGVQKLCGWKDEKTLIYASFHDSFSPRVTFLYELDVTTDKITPLNLGHASTLAYDGKVRVLGKNIGDPARWKRYRGGTAGTLWVDEQGKDNFKKILPKLSSNLANPIWIEGRLFFISDHEGISNIYSCNKKGQNLKRHTHCDDYYVRSFSYDDGKLCFQSGASLYLHELKSGTTSDLDIQVHSSFNQSTPRIEDADEFLQEFTLREDGKELALVSRGQLFHRTPWKGTPQRKGEEHLRYKIPTYLKDYSSKKGHNRYLLAVELNRENEETIRFYDLEENPLEYKGKTLAKNQEWGKIQEIRPAPEKNLVAISNNRNELFLLTYPQGKVEKITSNEHHFYKQFSWSPCGRYLAYSEPLNRTTHGLKIYDVKKKEARSLIDPVLHDFCPVFAPEGDYLYFLGIREFHPNYSETHFELSFPFAVRPYAIVLEKDAPSPLDLYTDFEEEQDGEEEEEAPKKKVSKKKAPSKKKAKKKSKPKSKKDQDSSEETVIDWEDLDQRIVPLPLPIGGHMEIACAQDKLFFLQYNVKGLDPFAPPQMAPEPNLYFFDLKEKKKELFQKNCHGFELSLDYSHMILDTDDGLRLVSTEAKPSEGADIGKKDGFISLENFKLRLDPKKEWKQMYQEAWILQREHFWTKDMNKIDWQKVYNDYLPLLDKVHTRAEFSDLMWEMQGELGTSHCYEFGGDYFRTPFSYSNGQLGAQLKWSPKNKEFTIENVARGDSWIKGCTSPLTAPGVGLKEGDKILGIDGRPFNQEEDLHIALEGRRGQKVGFIVHRKGSSQAEEVEIIPSAANHQARYRQWVNKNKEYVHKKSQGKIGYVHIPNMGVSGFSEFYRNFLSECTKEGLIVDVRYNGGGHVSQHILKILAQKVIGFDKTRYMGIEPYPAYAINGPVVALTNEHAGSDGDIFSHSFKLMEIGPLIGTRTWGGVVGIWPRHPLNDGTITCQPEFSFWFKDVGYQVENYGTDPDIEVERTPKDWKEDKDPQLDRALKEALALRKKNPPLSPNLNQGRPNLKAPKLPKN